MGTMNGHQPSQGMMHHSKDSMNSTDKIITNRITVMGSKKGTDETNTNCKTVCE